MLDCSLHLVHAVPGRTRLRWRGDGAPPRELLARLATAPQVARVDYRPASRSLVLHHEDVPGIPVLRKLIEDSGVRVEDGAPASAAETESAETESKEGAKPAPGPPVLEATLADLEAVALVLLMGSWIRDLVVTRRVRIATLFLLIVTAINLYNYWKRRWASPEPDPESPNELELIAA